MHFDELVEQLKRKVEIREPQERPCLALVARNGVVLSSVGPGLIGGQERPLKRPDSHLGAVSE